MPVMPELSPRPAPPRSRWRTWARVGLYLVAGAALVTAAWGVDWRAGLVTLALACLVAEAIVGGAR